MLVVAAMKCFAVYRWNTDFPMSKWISRRHIRSAAHQSTRVWFIIRQTEQAWYPVYSL